MSGIVNHNRIEQESMEVDINENLTNYIEVILLMRQKIAVVNSK